MAAVLGGFASSFSLCLLRCIDDAAPRTCAHRAAPGCTLLPIKIDRLGRARTLFPLDRVPPA